MSRALLCPSSGARDYVVVYHTGRFCFSLQPGHYSSLTAPNLQPTANQERNDQRGNPDDGHINARNMLSP